MIVVFRLLWALFLSGLVAFAFHRFWRWEHGGFIPVPLFGDTSRYLSKDTVVWVTPLIFPILIIITFVLLLLLDEDINHFFLFILDVMLTISVYFLALFLLLPVLRHSFSARACATLWLLPVFLFYQLYPLIRTSSPPLFFVYIPGVVLRVCSLLWMIGFSFELLWILKRRSHRRRTFWTRICILNWSGMTTARFSHLTSPSSCSAAPSGSRTLRPARYCGSVGGMIRLRASTASHSLSGHVWPLICRWRRSWSPPRSPTGL